VNAPFGAYEPSAIALTEAKVIATYEAHAVFQNNKAQILVAVRKVGGRWMINAFRVNSDLFLRQ
jgi:hypothetical protein